MPTWRMTSQTAMRTRETARKRSQPLMDSGREPATEPVARDDLAAGEEAGEDEKDAEQLTPVEGAGVSEAIEGAGQAGGEGTGRDEDGAEDALGARATAPEAP